MGEDAVGEGCRPERIRVTPELPEFVWGWNYAGMGWPHAPVHWMFSPGIYMVTAGTLHKEPLFDRPDRKELAQESLFAIAGEFGWKLEAWAVLSNHYHFVARSPDDPASLVRLLRKLHGVTARAINGMDGTPGRRVWFQYWDSRITYERSYLARLRYVHTNPVHHGVAVVAESYRWCSASWFAEHATRAFCETVGAMPLDRLKVVDDF